MANLEVRPLDASYGAEVHGVDLREIDDATMAELRRAFDDYGLLIFKDVEFPYATQQRFVEMLVGAQLSHEDPEEMPSSYVSNRIDDATSASGRINFHADGMWSEEPFKLVSLYAVDVEDGAPPTIFASMEKAWETLPADLKARVEGLHAVQSQGTYRGRELEDDGLTVDPRAAGRHRTTPVALKHPRTGKTVLYLCEQQTREIVELDEDEGTKLLDELLARISDPANVIEYQWHTGDFVAWDNLAVLHARPNVAMDGPARTLRRAVVPPGWLWSKQYAERTTGAASGY
jgi:taurine dioxygenase